MSTEYVVTRGAPSRASAAPAAPAAPSPTPATPLASAPAASPRPPPRPLPRLRARRPPSRARSPWVASSSALPSPRGPPRLQLLLQELIDLRGALITALNSFAGARDLTVAMNTPPGSLRRTPPARRASRTNRRSSPRGSSPPAHLAQRRAELRDEQAHEVLLVLAEPAAYALGEDHLDSSSGTNVC